MSTCIYKDFIDNKYYQLYMKLLSASDITNEYTEVHHILPRSLGGLDNSDNLVRITARKHFLAHYLLTKFTIQNSNSWHSMIKAFSMMSFSSDNQNRYMNSRLYEANRKHMSTTMSILQSGSSNSQFGTMWIYNPLLKQNKKIKKDEIIPDGWVKGRYYANSKKSTEHLIRKCKICGKIGCMSPAADFCSIECKLVSLREKLCKQKPISLKLPKIKLCKACNKEKCSTKYSNFCSPECRRINNRNMFSKLDKINKDNFISMFLELKSIIKTLKTCGVAGAGANTVWANETILESGNFEAICILMRNKKRR